MFGSLQLTLEWRGHFRGLSQLKCLIKFAVSEAYFQFIVSFLFRSASKVASLSFLLYVWYEYS